MHPLEEVPSSYDKFVQLEGHLTDLEFGDWSKREENKALLRKLVVQFQSEWDGREPDQRWGWVKEMWANPIKHETAALQNKKAWVEAQKAQAMRSLPVLEQRVLKAKGWRSQIAAKKADAETALAAAQTSQDEARKAREDFISDVGGQSTQLAPLTPPKQHQDAVLAKRKGLAKALDAAIDARKQAEARVKETAPMLAKAEAWVTREETKYRAAKDGIALADPLMADLQKSIEATAKQTVAPNAASQAEKDFTEYKAYMKALQFWEQIPGLPDSKVWHFHPLAFIEFFRKCHWLSKEELVAIYPDGIYKKTSNPNVARSKHQVALNRVMWKYGIVTPMRQAHFLGQGGHECAHLSEMHELGDEKYLSKYDHNGDLGNDAAGEGELFKGRGMKQITGRYNYMRYWVYRGWLPNSWMSKKWTLNRQDKKKTEEEQAKIRKHSANHLKLQIQDQKHLKQLLSTRLMREGGSGRRVPPAVSR